MDKLINAKKIANTNDMYIVNGKVISCRHMDRNNISVFIK